jgi:hypothetical protein
MDKVKSALEEFRISHMSEYPENEQHGRKKDEILETMTQEERELYDLFVIWYFNGQRDAFERIVD